MEIIGSNFVCDLAEVHLNLIDPINLEEQEQAFKAASLHAVSLLHQRFEVKRMQISRELDPIIGVSFTGLFDFFVKAFGSDWLRWWQSGRDRSWNDATVPGSTEPLISVLNDNYSTAAEYYLEGEQLFLSSWKEVVEETVYQYCDRHNLKRPNRYTTVQPSGTKSLLTGASPGWHPPKATRYIRRITFGKNDPVALACIDYGYSVVPSQSDKDEDGNLLNDPFSDRCTEWLIEIPVEVPWAHLAEDIDLSKLSVIAQFDFFMQVQTHYTTHNTSSTLELSEDEIEPLGKAIYRAIANDEPYVSCAIMARSLDNKTYPRLPFEPISKKKYLSLRQQMLDRRKYSTFEECLQKQQQEEKFEQGAAPCDSDKCLMPKQQ